MKSDPQPRADLNPQIQSFLLEIYQRSNGAALGITPEHFIVMLSEIQAKYLPVDAAPGTVREFFGSLRLEDLILARACAAGNERAWEIFLSRFREKIYDVAGYIARETSAARELADSLYAELYGTSLRDGHRVSKLASYTGRGSLEGWLRTIIAQEHINQYRRRRRFVSLDGETDQGAQFASTDLDNAATSIDSKLESATDDVLAALPAENRFILASYYLEDRTLAEIAQLLGVHESTISRKLDKLLKSLRKQILAGLGRRGLSRRQAEEALEVDIRDIRHNIRERLMQETAAPAFSERKAEMPEGK